MIRRRCTRKGHKWRQKSMYMLGDDVCARWRCDGTRLNPDALPPWLDYSEYVDDLVDEWHANDNMPTSLQEFIQSNTGWTDAEYESWVLTAKIPRTGTF